MKRQLKQWLAFVLMATLIINMVGVCLAESGTVSGFGEQTSVAESGMLTIPKTPEQAREMLGAMLGMSAEELDQ